MNNRRYRHRLLALSASILLGLSGLSSSAVDAAEVTVEQPAADTTVSQDTGNPSADHQRSGRRSDRRRNDGTGTNRTGCLL